MRRGVLVMLLISLTTTFSMNLYVATPTVHACDKCNFLLAWGSSVRRSGNGQFNNPQGLAVYSSGNVYVADTSNNRVQKFSSDGKYLTQWGSYGDAGTGQFSYPHGIAADSSGNVYITNWGDDRVQKFGDLTPSDLTRSLWTQYSQPYLILPIILIGIIIGVVLNRRRSKAKESPLLQ
jgi:DNA-binding beta-propeller fold protein YncE